MPSKAVLIHVLQPKLAALALGPFIYRLCRVSPVACFLKVCLIYEAISALSAFLSQRLAAVACSWPDLRYPSVLASSMRDQSPVCSS